MTNEIITCLVFTMSSIMSFILKTIKLKTKMFSLKSLILDLNYSRKAMGGGGGGGVNLSNLNSVQLRKLPLFTLYIAISSSFLQ